MMPQTIPAWLVPVATYVAWPTVLGLAVVLPIIIVVLLARRHHDVRARLTRLGTPATVSRLFSLPPQHGWRLRAALLGSAACCLGVALAGPRWGNERTAMESSGADVVIAIDASLSMLATDERPNRLERVKEEIRRLRDLSPGDRVALLAFAGRSYILTPLTIDDGALDLFLDNLDPSVVGQPGTSLSRAIRQGTDLLLTTHAASDRAIVLMSDGEGFELADDVRREAARAAENGISLVTVGFGTERGSTIPMPSGRAGDSTVPKRDENGEVVTTRYSPVLLQAAADAAHGTFVPSFATDKAANIRRALAKLRVTRRSIERGETLSPRFQLFLIPALVLLVVDTIFRDRRLRVPRALAPLALVATAAANTPASDSTNALAIYRRPVVAGDRSPRALYNYGTALLHADSIESAIGALTAASTTRDPELRYRALYNLGLAHLRRGLAARTDAGNPELDAALDAYKRALLTRPGDRDATWNYELALHKKSTSGGGGGGGGKSPKSRRASESPQSAPAPAPAGDLGERQAEELLNSAAREERDVEGKSQKQNAAEVPPGGKDW